MKKEEVPSSVDEAIREREEQIELIQELQLQLGNPNVVDRDNRRMDGHDYLNWRHRVKVKLRYVTTRVRELNQWIKDQNIQKHDEKEELKTALEEYGTHLDDCPWWDPEGRCNCGLDELFTKYGLEKLEREVSAPG